MLNVRLIAALLITVLVFIGGCATPEAPAEGNTSILPMIIFLVVIFALFYFLMMRPQRRRQKEQETMTRELQRGDEIITAGGIYGKIESLHEDNVVIKVESGATIRVARSSVMGRREK